MELPPRDKLPLAEPTGTGYADDAPEVKEQPKQPEPVEKVNDLQQAMRDSGAKLDSTGQYTTVPVFKSQLDAGNIKISNVEVDIFDLSQPADLEKYRKLKSELCSETSGLMPISEDRRFIEKNGSWKVYVEWAKILYKLPGNIKME